MIHHGDLEFVLPKLVLLPGDGKHHRLAEDWHILFRGEWYSVPRGFVTDGASIPAVLRIVCGDPNKAPRIYPAILHDWGYHLGGSEGDRRRYDDLYRDVQIALGIPRFKAYVEWAALRACGGGHFGKRKTRKVNSK